MKLWLISQEENTGYDTYDSAVVAADNEAGARLIHPDGHEWRNGDWCIQRADGTWFEEYCHTWASSPDQVQVQLIGEAVEGTNSGVICASFNAG